MKFTHTFWLIGLTAAFVVPAAAQNHCTGSSQFQSNADPSSGTVIQASSKPTGITITGVN